MHSFSLIFNTISRHHSKTIQDPKCSQITFVCRPHDDIGERKYSSVIHGDWLGLIEDTRARNAVRPPTFMSGVKVRHRQVAGYVNGEVEALPIRDEEFERKKK